MDAKQTLLSDIQSELQQVHEQTVILTARFRDSKITPIEFRETMLGLTGRRKQLQESLWKLVEDK